MKKTLILFACFLTCFLGVSQAQVTVAPFVNSHQQFFNAGAPCNGCKLFTYQAGTSTLQNTYSDSAGTIANSDPIVLDSTGSATIYMTAASYKFVLQTSAGVTIWTQDNVSWANIGNTVTSLTSNGTLQVIPSTAATSGANQSGPLSENCANVWNGSASVADCWTLQDVVGTGSNPTSTWTLTHFGSSGTASINFGSFAIQGGAATLGSVNTPSIGATTPGTGAFTTTTADTLNGMIMAGGTAYPCTATGLNNALKALPSGGGVVHAEGCGSLSLSADIFSGVTGKGIVYFPCGVLSTSAVQNPPKSTGITYQGCTGAVTIGALAPTYGTVFKWTGGVAPATGIFNVFDNSYSSFRDMAFDCNNVAGTVGMNIDSDNAPASTKNSFKHMLFMNCDKGMLFGAGNTGEQVDQSKIDEVSCYTLTGTHKKCIEFVASNSSQAVDIGHLWADGTVTDGVDFDGASTGGFVRIHDCAGGAATNFIHVENDTAGIVENCQNEGGGSFFVDSGSNALAPWTLMGNIINQPVTITSVALINSIGNHYTSTPSANDDAWINSIGDTYDAGHEWSLSGNSQINNIFSNYSDGNPNQNRFNCTGTNGCVFSNVSNSTVASVSSAGLGTFNGGLASGTNAAASGAVRTPNNTCINFRNAANSADLPLACSTSSNTATYGANGEITTNGTVQVNVNFLLHSTTFASLGTPTNGTEVYCSDCTLANPCASGGTGAVAKRINGAWVCN